jgi:hypothetical protein
MKRDRLSFLIIVAISFLFPLSCTYAHYNDIMEADFLTRGTKYEAADIENLVVDKYNLTGVTPPLASAFAYLNENFLGPYLAFPLSTPSNHLASSVLRC